MGILIFKFPVVTGVRQEDLDRINSFLQERNPTSKFRGFGLYLLTPNSLDHVEMDFNKDEYYIKFKFFDSDSKEKTDCRLFCSIGCFPEGFPYKFLGIKRDISFLSYIAAAEEIRKIEFSFKSGNLNIVIEIPDAYMHSTITDHQKLIYPKK